MTKVARLCLALLVSTLYFGWGAAYASDAEDLYIQSCANCHDVAMHGAPVPGGGAVWDERLAYGLEDIYLNTIEGIGAMPARGGCTDCSDAELRAVVDFMMREPE